MRVLPEGDELSHVQSGFDYCWELYESLMAKVVLVFQKKSPVLQKSTSEPSTGGVHEVKKTFPWIEFCLAYWQQEKHVWAIKWGSA